MEPKRVFKEWAESLVQAAIIIIILYFVFWPVKIDGISMEKTFYHGDRVIISRVVNLFAGYELGDIIVISEEIEDKELDVIKRVIAIPGDEILIYGGEVYINGNLLVEDYIEGRTYGDTALVVPEGCYFVLGDNREHSADSRVFGVVTKKQIVGKVILRWYPLSQFKLF